MRIFEQIKAIIEEHPHSSSSYLLAQALASACNYNNGVSLLAASVKLDSTSKALFLELASVTDHADYRNSDQDDLLRWLRERKFID